MFVGQRKEEGKGHGVRLSCPFCGEVGRRGFYSRDFRVYRLKGGKRFEVVKWFA